MVPILFSDINAPTTIFKLLAISITSLSPIIFKIHPSLSVKIIKNSDPFKKSYNISIKGDATFKKLLFFSILLVISFPLRIFLGKTLFSSIPK
ncbi:hypothetical protein CFSAN002368_02432 [Clostridium botulinum A1 str. CFSAN002368]|nr:hypothetical protein CFSAN002368_02432 [Clostridium botulinum A1 str. CFSAN002368]